jgi:hypothetical protein
MPTLMVPPLPLAAGDAEGELAGELAEDDAGLLVLAVGGALPQAFKNILVPTVAPP